MRNRMLGNGQMPRVTTQWGEHGRWGGWQTQTQRGVIITRAVGLAGGTRGPGL